MALWEDVLAQYGIGREGQGAAPLRSHLPAPGQALRRRAWREQPVFALIHQTYLVLAERVLEAVDAGRRARGRPNASSCALRRRACSMR
jgi:polyhydroxyalkanoate synthase